MPTARTIAATKRKNDRRKEAEEVLARAEIARKAAIAAYRTCFLCNVKDANVVDIKCLCDNAAHVACLLTQRDGYSWSAIEWDHCLSCKCLYKDPILHNLTAIRPNVCARRLMRSQCYLRADPHNIEAQGVMKRAIEYANGNIIVTNDDFTRFRQCYQYYMLSVYSVGKATWGEEQTQQMNEFLVAPLQCNERYKERMIRWLKATWVLLRLIDKQPSLAPKYMNVISAEDIIDDFVLAIASKFIDRTHDVRLAYRFMKHAWDEHGYNHPTTTKFANVVHRYWMTTHTELDMMMSVAALSLCASTFDQKMYDYIIGCYMYNNLENAQEWSMKACNCRSIVNVPALLKFRDNATVIHTKFEAYAIIVKTYGEQAEWPDRIIHDCSEIYNSLKSVVHIFAIMPIAMTLSEHLYQKKRYEEAAIILAAYLNLKGIDDHVTNATNNYIIYMKCKFITQWSTALDGWGNIDPYVVVENMIAVLDAVKHVVDFMIRKYTPKHEKQVTPFNDVYIKMQDQYIQCMQNKLGDGFFEDDFWDLICNNKDKFEHMAPILAKFYTNKSTVL